MSFLNNLNCLIKINPIAFFIAYIFYIFCRRVVGLKISLHENLFIMFVPFYSKKD